MKPRLGDESVYHIYVWWWCVHFASRRDLYYEWRKLVLVCCASIRRGELCVVCILTQVVHKLWTFTSHGTHFVPHIRYTRIWWNGSKLVCFSELTNTVYASHSRRDPSRFGICHDFVDILYMIYRESFLVLMGYVHEHYTFAGIFFSFVRTQ